MAGIQMWHQKLIFALATGLCGISLPVRAGAQGAPDGVEIAIQYHIEDEPHYSREPWSSLWMQTQPDFQARFGGPTRLSFHTAQGHTFASLVPVHADGSLDFERMMGWRSLGKSVVLEFFKNQQVTLNRSTGLITAILSSSGAQGPLNIGRVLGPNAVQLCTGEFRTVCSLHLEGQHLRIGAPLDWSHIQIPLSKVDHFPSCSGADLVLPRPETSSIRRLVVVLTLDDDSKTGCGELLTEMKVAQNIFATNGIEVFFTTQKSEHLPFLPLRVVRSISDESDGGTGHFDSVTKSIFIGQPRFGRRLANVLAHEIGHALGLEHVSFEGNLMMGGGVTPLETELSAEQKEIIWGSELLTPGSRNQ